MVYTVMADNSWDELAKYVLEELKHIPEMIKEMGLIQRDIAVLQVKNGLYLSLVSAVTILAVAVIAFLKR